MSKGMGKDMRQELELDLELNLELDIEYHERKARNSEDIARRHRAAAEKARERLRKLQEES